MPPLCSVEDGKDPASRPPVEARPCLLFRPGGSFSVDCRAGGLPYLPPRHPESPPRVADALAAGTCMRSSEWRRRCCFRSPEEAPPSTSGRCRLVAAIAAPGEPPVRRGLGDGEDPQGRRLCPVSALLFLRGEIEPPPLPFRPPGYPFDSVADLL